MNSRLTGMVAGGCLLICAGATADDTHCEHQVLYAPDGAATHTFGYSVAVDGQWIAVGARNATASVTNEGAVYMFQLQGGAWTFVRKIIAPDNFPANEFGRSVDLDGDTLIVGSPFDDDGCPSMGNCNSGTASIFQRDVGGANNWGFVKRLTATTPAANAFFGKSVAISGDWAIAGEHGPIDGGSAYLFKRDEGGADNWGFVQRIQPVGVAVADQSGWSVDIDGDRCIISAHKRDPSALFDAGAAYVFSRAGNVWTQDGELIAPDAAVADNFSYDVAIHGDTALVGSPFDDDNGSASGSIYVFKRELLGWTFVTKRSGSATVTDDQHGLSVALDAGNAITGAYFGGPGDAYVHRQDLGGANNWGELAQFTGTASGIYYGWDVSIDGPWAVVGAYRESTLGGEAGAAFVIFLGDNDCDDNGLCDDVEIADDSSLDLNSNGKLDVCECGADITDNGATNMPDGVVNLFDLLLLLDNWGTGGDGADIAAPLGTVDLFDLLAMLDEWGDCP